ncbi:relaxase/mobilization nuclease domain-containing protein [Brucella gallinifaecis]|uniref:Relaxase n=1 Tax=Brucella gallinifaecis TaxID=215590 RepID=A0A502BJM0_9HYPH|nr:relaxase/mobilization nuclease domain-containing protein [Brucella gallinifaecis]TPF74037.1 relaxase [Brucella gallinifaecis]
MILKGSQRAGARQLAAHLLNDRDNDHVTVFELRGFVAHDLMSALEECHAVSTATRCKQFLFSLSLNPPQGIVASEEELRRAADRAEKALGLDDQPRAIVFHEKNGRRHAHVVWSRIDPERLTAINLPHYKNRLTALSRELYLEHDWPLPNGLRHDGGKNPLNLTLAEWQQAKRLDADPREIKQVFVEAWSRSDSAKAFGNALAERGYFLARGDRRGFVAIDVHGAVFSVSRWTGAKSKDVREKLGDPQAIPALRDVHRHVRGLVNDQLRGFIAQFKQRQKNEMHPLIEERNAIKRAHQAERKLLAEKQDERWQAENAARSERLAKGLSGFWQRVSGKAKAIREQNEREAIEAMRRDRAQRDRLVFAQMEERKTLQSKFDILRERQMRDRRLMAREVVQSMRQASQLQEKEIRRTQERRHDPSLVPRRNRGPSHDL